MESENQEFTKLVRFLQEHNIDAQKAHEIAVTAVQSLKPAVSEGLRYSNFNNMISTNAQSIIANKQTKETHIRN